ncbi:hypothetical protein OHA35_07350 [Streptomyces sp. NBC_00233]|nr:hypothetical protein [Streptomyces sp. NBC_00233]
MMHRRGADQEIDDAPCTVPPLPRPLVPGGFHPAPCVLRDAHRREQGSEVLIDLIAVFRAHGAEEDLRPSGLAPADSTRFDLGVPASMRGGIDAEVNVRAGRFR